jgi:hypothetical protein
VVLSQTHRIKGNLGGQPILGQALRLQHLEESIKARGCR